MFPHHVKGNMHDLSLQADSNVALEDVIVHDEYCHEIVDPAQSLPISSVKIHNVVFCCSHNDSLRMNTLKTSWNQKMKIRLEAKAVKARERELQEARSKELQVRGFAFRSGYYL